MNYDVIVIGAGINGLCAAYHLISQNVGKIAILEQFTVGHAQGSSHGQSRITRSSYSSPKYVELIQLAHEEEWPRLQRDSGQEFLYPRPGCFFGPGVGPYLESVRSVPSLLSHIQVLETSDARKLAPQFLFPDSPLVIHDLTCSVIAAQKVMAWLATWVAKSADIVENSSVVGIEPGSDEIRLHTSTGTYRCGRLVVTAGAWLPRLCPEISSKVRVAQQDVGYYQIEGGDDLPVWVYCAANGESFYGLPEFGRPGMKVARHRTQGSSPGMSDNPDRPLPTVMPLAARQDLDSFVAAQFARPTHQIDYEACLYTNSVREDFLLDHHPLDHRVVIGSACSGHGFKFGPLTGRILCELLLDGRTSIETFEKHRDSFRIGSQPNWSDHSSK